MKATEPCVVAYGYVRIRRLVRFGVGFIVFRSLEKQRSGLVDLPHRRITVTLLGPL